MGVLVMFVMFVFMLVIELMMLMDVLVSLGQMEPDPERHQGRRGDQSQRHGLV